MLKTRIGTARAFAGVAAAMMVLFLLPKEFFVAATFGATGLMMLAAFFTGSLSWPRLRARPVLVGLVSACVLYATFYGGNLAISEISIPGLTTASETSIYSLIAAPSNPLILQVAVLAFDAVGYEAFFRGTIQPRLEPRLGVGAGAVVALLDAALHLATLNILWVATTFIADLAWGLTFYYGRDLSSSLTSHFLWDMAIFILRPIR